MKYKKLCEDINIPKNNTSTLKHEKNIKFNYYLSSRMNGKFIDLDITSKLFSKDQMFIRKSCYRVHLGEIENCVKANIIDHMKSLGVTDENIPQALNNINRSNQAFRLSSRNAYRD